MDNLLLVVTFSTALSAGLVAGVFFAFSTFIMRALARLPAPQGIAAMQSINVVVITPLFMLALFGTGIVCLLLAGYSLFKEPPLAGRMYLLTGGMIYFVSNVVVTIAFNVPKNNALAAANPASAEGSSSVGRLSRDLDRVEPCANDRSARRRCAPHGGDHPVTETSQDFYNASRHLHDKVDFD